MGVGVAKEQKRVILQSEVAAVEAGIRERTLSWSDVWDTSEERAVTQEEKDGQSFFQIMYPLVVRFGSETYIGVYLRQSTNQFGERFTSGASINAGRALLKPEYALSHLATFDSEYPPGYRYFIPENSILRSTFDHLGTGFRGVPAKDQVATRIYVFVVYVRSIEISECSHSVLVEGPPTEAYCVLAANSVRAVNQRTDKVHDLFLGLMTLADARRLLESLPKRPALDLAVLEAIQMGREFRDGRLVQSGSQALFVQGLPHGNPISLLDRLKKKWPLATAAAVLLMVLLELASNVLGVRQGVVDMLRPKDSAQEQNIPAQGPSPAD